MASQRDQARRSRRLPGLVRLALLCALALGGALGVSAQTTPHPAGDFYGLNSVAPVEPWLSLARESGAGVVRWQFNWRDHEPTPGNWVWDASDGPLRAWRAGGLQVHAILHNPPDYALARPGGLVPTNIHLPWNHPDNRWGAFCHAFAQRYRGQIASYEVWNEPDLAIYWEGSAEGYFHLMRSCYQAIKAADPSVPVSMAGMAMLIKPDFYPEVVRLAASDPDGARNNYYFDAVSVHSYASPELVYTLTQQMRQTLNRYRIGGKPIWITETNIPLRGAGIAPDYPHWRYATQDEAAWYVLQAVSNAYAAGAEKIMFFRLADDNMEEAFGLVASDGTRRPAYRALRLATTLMVDIIEARREVREGVVITNLRRADGARIVTMYSVTGVTVDLSIRADASAGVLINAVGGHSTIKPDEQGNYHVSLLPARGRDYSRLEDYSVGGPPLVIVEYDQDGPVTTLDVTRPPDSGQAVLRWQGDDGEYGTGVASYDVSVSRDGGPWQPWLTETTEERATYDLSEGGTFAFRAWATDSAGNVGPPTEEVIRYYGTLAARIVDLRGQPVPSARVELEDNTLHDTDAAGELRLDLLAGPYTVRRVDGSAQGVATPPPFDIELGQETQVTWLLLPRDNAIRNGDFEGGLAGWRILSDGDATLIDLRTEQGQVLRLQGGRRPWGSPAISTSVQVPPGMDAGVLTFVYRLPVGEQTLRLRAITDDGQRNLWRADRVTPHFARASIDVGAYAGQRVELRFELWGAKGTGGGIAEIDDVLLAAVPLLPSSGP